MYIYADEYAGAEPPSLTAGTWYATSQHYETDVSQGTKVTLSYTVSPVGRTRARYYDAGGTGAVTREALRAPGGAEFTIAEYGYTTANVRYGNHPAVPVLAYRIDARGAETSFEYEYAGVMTRELGADGLIQSYRYDLRNRITKEWRGAGDANDVTTLYEYDHADNLTKTTEDYGTGRLNSTTAYEYSIRNFQTKVTDARGNVRTKSYTTGGALEWEAAFASGGSGNVLSQTKYEYDGNGRLTKRSIASDDGPFGLNSPAGWVDTFYAFDAYGRQTQVIEDYGGGCLNLSTTYDYNNQDEVVKTTTPGGVWTETKRDGRGLTTMQISGYHAGEQSIPQVTTSYEYDADGNLTKQGRMNAQGSYEGPVTTYEYDGYGRRAQVIRS